MSDKNYDVIVMGNVTQLKKRIEELEEENKFLRREIERLETNLDDVCYERSMNPC